MEINGTRREVTPKDAELENSPEALLRRARTLTREGNPAAAADLARELLDRQPDSLSAATELIRALEAGGASSATAGRGEAEAALRRLISAAPTPANIMAAARFWEQWQEDEPATPGVRTVRAALTGHGTLLPLGAHLRVACAQAGMHPFVFVSDFDQWMQDLLTPNSALYASRPEVILLQLDAGTLFPRSMGEAELSAAAFDAERTAGLAQIRQALAAAGRNAPAATLLLSTFATPDHSPLGILDLGGLSDGLPGQRERCERINADLRTLVRAEFPRTLLLDMERIEARHGKERVRDARRWYLASIPFSDSFLPVLAGEYLRYLRPLKGQTRKCVVLDLDNTLWGGVIGEDGFDQIKIGGTAAPGNAFRDFQRALLALQQRGILLAVCSKNNPEDVWPVFDKHPGMVLRREHLAAWRINWQDKATNIRELARDLNIGLDSLVFLDDNPAERGLVRQEVPQVLTVEMPTDPALYVRTLLALDVFEVLTLTEEDRNRGRLYREQQERKAFEEQLEHAAESGGDLTDYLRGLQMRVTIASATDFTLPRIAQLINKTNQFNVTTRRYTEAEVRALAADRDHWRIYSVHVSDRFGDSGLTGVAMVRTEGEVWEVDNFLLSCRVLGRGVEDALMTHVIHEAAAAGASRLRGVFIKTAKNAPAADFFEKQGFLATGAGEGDESYFELALAGGSRNNGSGDAPTDAPAAADRQYPAWLAVEIASANPEENSSA
jgi:HAD-superfamily phosphatase, subfamily IIIC/FkbH-like domain